MIRPFAVFAILALTLGATTAQETAPAEAPEIVVDPAASLNTSPKQANMLTGFYATMAVIDICAIAVEPDITAGMDADRQRLETALGMDPATAAAAYEQVRTDVEKTTPDCAEGSSDRLGVDAVTAIYAALPPPEPAPADGTSDTPAP